MRLAKFLLWLGWLALLAGSGGCGLVPTEESASARSPPPLRLGDPFVVLLKSPGQFAAAMDLKDHVHLLTTTEKGGVEHYTISEAGRVDVESLPVTRPIKRYAIATLAIAVAHDGRVHVAINSEHLVLGESPTRPLPAPRCEDLLAVGEGLVCATLGKGEKARWDFPAIGGPLGGFIIPLPSIPGRIVLYRYFLGSWQPWGIVDRNRAEEISDFEMAADAQGRIDLAYTTVKTAFIVEDTNQNLRYAQLPSPFAADQSSARIGLQDMDTQSLKATVMDKPVLAVDPETGVAMIAFKTIDNWRTLQLIGGRIQKVLDNSPTLGGRRLGTQLFPTVGRVYDVKPQTWPAPILVPSGRNGFYALVPYRHAFYVEMWRDQQWSTPEPIGRGQRLSFLVADPATGLAFAAWTDLDGRLVGRWINRIE